MGLVAEAGSSVICHICRAGTTRKRRKRGRASGVIPLAFFISGGCAHVRRGIKISKENADGGVSTLGDLFDRKVESYDQKIK